MNQSINGIGYWPNNLWGVGTKTVRPLILQVAKYLGGLQPWTYPPCQDAVARRHETAAQTSNEEEKDIQKSGPLFKKNKPNCISHLKRRRVSGKALPLGGKTICKWKRENTHDPQPSLKKIRSASLGAAVRGTTNCSHGPTTHVCDHHIEWGIGQGSAHGPQREGRNARARPGRTRG